MRKKWEKPKEGFTTDPDIVMECLFEVYEKETPAVLSGKNIRHTMIYPFLKMLQHVYKNYTLELLHKKLWVIYWKFRNKEEFIKRGLLFLNKEDHTYN